MRHRRLSLVDLTVFIGVVILSLLLLLYGDALFNPERSDGMPAWCEHHDGDCLMISEDPVRLLD